MLIPNYQNIYYLYSKLKTSLSYPNNAFKVVKFTFELVKFTAKLNTIAVFAWNDSQKKYRIFIFFQKIWQTCSRHLLYCDLFRGNIHFSSLIKFPIPIYALPNEIENLSSLHNFQIEWHFPAGLLWAVQLPAAIPLGQEARSARGHRDRGRREA